MWKLVGVPTVVLAALIFFLAAWAIYKYSRGIGNSQGLCALAAIGGAIVATLIGGYFFIMPMLQWAMKQTTINQ